MSKKLYSAAEIAKMAIPGLPATRANIGLKAEREGWYSEERIGIGGRRKVYEVPANYLARLELQAGEPLDQDTKPRIVRAPVNRSMRREPPAEVLDATAFIGSEDREQKLQILGAIELWLIEQNAELEPEKKLRAAELLYEHFKEQGAFDDNQLNLLLKMATS